MRLVRATRDLAWDPWLRGVLAAGALILLLLARFFPWGLMPTLCLWKRLSGHPCPSCGMTRSWVHMAHGRPIEALAQNPMGALLFAGTVAALLYGALRAAGLLGPLRVDVDPREARCLRIAAVTALAANWAYVWMTGVA